MLNISIQKNVFVYEDKIYDRKYFDDRAICQPVVEQNRRQQQKYQWGFSFIQLEIVLYLLTLWTVGIHIMWSTAHLRSVKMGISYKDPGNFKSAMSLADAIRKEFKQKTNKDITSFTERQLMSSIKTHLNGGQVMVQSPPPIPEQIASKLIPKWVKANEGWVVVIPLLFLTVLALVAGLVVGKTTTI